MYYSIKTALSWMLFSSLIIGLSACGSGGTGSSDSETGSVGILLTDGPTDDFDAVNVTITKAELLSDKDRVTIFEGDKTVNLLDYKNDSQLFSLSNTVPTGSYKKIRLTLSNIELVKCEDQPSATFDVATCTNTIEQKDQPELKGSSKLDLNPRGPINVAPGATLMVQIDMDAKKSIQIVESGNGKYKFRPVVFVDIISDAVPAKLVRINGTIESLMTENSQFELCSSTVSLLLANDLNDQAETTCLDIVYDNETSIFAEDGTVTSPEALMEGDMATVIGRIRISSEDDDSSDDDSSDDDSSDDDSQNNSVEGVYLDAIVIDLGEESDERGLNGVALSEVDQLNVFNMSIDSGQGITEGSAVAVLVQEGTRIINKMGEDLDRSVIQSGAILTVDGELQLSEVDPALLIAEMIVVDATSAQKLIGEISLAPDDVCGFTLQTEVGDRSIRTSNSTKILRVLADATEELAPEELMAGDKIEAYGEFNSDGCFDSSVIVIFEEPDTLL